MPAPIEPPELARLIDFSERPRTRDWSLRAALVRYAQPQPQRVNDILDLVRRIEAALAQHAATLEGEGPALWNALATGAPAGPNAPLVALLRAADEVDHFGDVLAAWAVDRAGTRPDAEADALIENVAGQLDALGVAREERPPPPRQRG